MQKNNVINDTLEKRIIDFDKVTELPSWQKLITFANRSLSLSDLFSKSEPNNYSKTDNLSPLTSNRSERFVIKDEHIYFDFSKQLITEKILDTLLSLANECQLKERINALLRGDKVNNSEDRAALHTALRLPETACLFLDNQNIVSDVHESLDAAEVLVNRIRDGIWRGFSGKAITDVVNLGVGGSDLGPLMVSTALEEWSDTDIQVHFVSNMDGSQLEGLLKKLNPETSIFIISSKSFGTLDTLSNAKTALTWLCQYAPQKLVLHRHFIGVSANLEKVSEWGIHPDNQLKFWDWVGGRFSLWSVIGLAIAIRIGMDNFRQLLAGANAMDEHFVTTEFTQNLPVMMGLLAVWNSTFLNIHAHTVLPYDGRLKYFPSYLTQLEMESNGKSVSRDGTPVDFNTCPILWGEVGSNAQHAFYQLLHQGTQDVSCDFIACVKRYSGKDAHDQTLQHQHELSLSNCLAQSRVLAFGSQPVCTDETNNSQKAKATDKFCHYHGNQPSTTILLDELTPYSLGSLIALYEHKVYVMASIWNINPFDQWGVEMGKKVASEVHNQLLHIKNTEELQAVQSSVQFSQNNHTLQDNKIDFDVSTDQLLRHIVQTQ